MILTEKADPPPQRPSTNPLNGTTVPSASHAEPPTQMFDVCFVANMRSSNAFPSQAQGPANTLANLGGQYSTMPRLNIPLKERSLDMFYTCFFLMHIPATLLLDLQAIYPPSLLPKWMHFLGQLYMEFTADPVVGSVNGYFGEQVQQSFTWLRLFMFSELLLQLPVFFYASYSFYSISSSTTPSDNPIPTLYPLLIAYGALTATTTLPCIAVLLSTPSTSTPLDFSSGLAHVIGSKAQEVVGRSVVRGLSNAAEVAAPALTDWQRWLLLGSYIPFFLIPLTIAVDMFFRTRFLTRKGVWVVQKGMTSKWD